MGCSMNVLEVSWDEVFARLRELPLEGEVVYGIPRNGMLLSAFVRSTRIGVTYLPEEASVFLDDLIDSGSTRDRYAAKYPDTPFHALFEKKPGDPWIKFPWETETGPEDAVIRLLDYIGEDSMRPGLYDTPKRVVKMLNQLTEGYSADIDQMLGVMFETEADELVVVRDVPFYSLCEHHMLPFHGTVSVGYIPRGKVVGLSKIPRLIHAFARRLQMQEQLTQQIADALYKSAIQPLGVGVIVRAHHTCMSMRGVQSQGEMVTSATYGIIRTSARDEFMRLAGIA